MKKIAKNFVKKILSLLHLKVSVIDGRQVSESNRLEWLRNLKIKTIIDVGANKGNATLEFLEIFSSATVFAFEPLPECFEIMKLRLKHLENVKLFNVALSNKTGSAKMNKSSYRASSSLLKMAELHKSLFPITKGETVISVETNTLDNIMSSEVFDAPVLMKIDVQGFEDQVLTGSKKTLEKIKIIIIETSFLELYVGQPLFDDIYRILTEQGFSYKGAWDPDFRSPVDGAHLQQDAIFMRPLSQSNKISV
jgi:FkbM family methyltransferase